jgi:hypothetical protein
MYNTFILLKLATFYFPLKALGMITLYTMWFLKPYNRKWFDERENKIMLSTA